MQRSVCTPQRFGQQHARAANTHGYEQVTTVEAARLDELKSLSGCQSRTLSVGFGRPT